MVAVAVILQIAMRMDAEMQRLLSLYVCVFTIMGVACPAGKYIFSFYTRLYAYGGVCKFQCSSTKINNLLKDKRKSMKTAW